MPDMIVDIDGDESKPCDSVSEAEDHIITLLNEGTSPNDITVSIIVREKVSFRVTSVEIKRKNGMQI